MEIHESTSDFAEQRGSHGRSVRPGAAATGRDLTLQHHDSIFSVDAALIDHIGDRLRSADVEDSLDSCLVGTGADEIGAASLAEQEAKSADYYRFPCACLAGEHVESSGQRKCQRFDDREVANPELGEHWRLLCVRRSAPAELHPHSLEEASSGKPHDVHGIGGSSDNEVFPGDELDPNLTVDCYEQCLRALRSVDGHFSLRWNNQRPHSECVRRYRSYEDRFDSRNHNWSTGRQAV